MLQFVCSPNDKYSQPELAQMALEGGCTWIQLRMPEGFSTEYLREVADDLVAMCREAAAFLTFENMPEQAREMGVHGVHISKGGMPLAIEVREQLGPEAVVGVELATLSDIDAAQHADIDYVTLPGHMEVEKASALIAAARRASITIPIVAAGQISVEDVPVLLAAGYNGIAVGSDIADAANPVERTEEYINLLKGL
ncbi:MAG: thiamine phosphate synthase [Muribaculaceae bacterium]|nr:thiamine phosphate synthase [Muribaculaceae bacterium]